MVDLGNDLFVENHEIGKVWRIQVKTALPKQANPNYFQFTIRETAIHDPSSTVSHFVFVLRVHSRWRMYIVAQPVLSNYAKKGMGSHVTNTGHRTFTFIFDPSTKSVSCSGVDISIHKNDWATWPQI